MSKFNVYKNILATTATELISAKDPFLPERINICNTSGSSTNITIRLESVGSDDTTKFTYNIIKDMSLNSGETLILEEKDLVYDITYYNLIIYSTQIVDVIVTNKNNKYEYNNKAILNGSRRSR